MKEPTMENVNGARATPSSAGGPNSAGGTRFTNTLNFANALKAVQAADAFLHGRHRGRGVAEQAGHQGLAEHVHRQLETLALERPTRLRVLVLGEFKAGKSSLINCLVGKSVAATDVGELTAAVCRILPIESGREVAVMRSGRAGSPDLEFSVPEFLAATKKHGEKARLGEPSALDGYLSADLYVRTLLPVELVDTPGLGAAEQNEQAAMDALAQADVVLLTIDCDNLGGARDTAVMDRIRVSGQPLLVAVTKIDLLDDGESDDGESDNGESDNGEPNSGNTDTGEQAEVLDFVSGSYQVPRAMLFPLSARHFERKGTDAGVERLREYLIRAAPERAALRDQAFLAQVFDLSAELKAGLEAVEAAIQAALDDVRGNQDLLEQTARLVTSDISASVASQIRGRLQAEAEGILMGQIHNPATRLTEGDFAAALEQSVQKMDTQPFWEQLKTSLETQFQKEWSEGIKRQLDALNANLELHRKDLHLEASAVSSLLAQEEQGRLARRNHAVGEAVAAGAAAVAMLAVGFPVLLIAAASIPGAWAYYLHKARSEQEASMGEIEYNARLAVSQWVSDYVREVMTGFEAKLLRENLQVAQRAADNYGCQQAEFAGTEEELSNLRKSAHHHIAALSALTAGSRLL